MGIEDNVIKKNDMDSDTTYLLCPDKTCKLFWDTSRWIPCESDCPYEDKLVKIIKCHACGELAELPGDHSSWQRVDHNCPQGWRAGNFQRMSGKYHIMYERPKLE